MSMCNGCTRCGMALSVGFISAMTLFAGCIGAPQDPAATQPVTITDPATTQPSYWYDKPAEVSITSTSFEHLTHAAETILRDYCFVIDRVDYRQGVITTEPLVGAQFFEPWRRDNQTMDDVAKSSLATHRRTVRVEIISNQDGSFTAAPKVLLERQTSAEQRISNVVAYRGAKRPTNTRDIPRGTKESDEGVLIPSKYWYSIGRDNALEKKLTDEIQSYVSHHGG